MYAAAPATVPRVSSVSRSACAKDSQNLMSVESRSSAAAASLALGLPLWSVGGRAPGDLHLRAAGPCRMASTALASGGKLWGLPVGRKLTHEGSLRNLESRGLVRISFGYTAVSATYRCSDPLSSVNFSHLCTQQKHRRAQCPTKNNPTCAAPFPSLIIELGHVHAHRKRRHQHQYLRVARTRSPPAPKVLRDLIIKALVSHGPSEPQNPPSSQDRLPRLPRLPR